MTEQASPPASADGSPPPEPKAGDGGAGTGSSDVSRTAAEAAPAPPAWKPSYVFLVVVSLVTLVADLASKSWAKARLDDARTWNERHIEVIKDHLGFIFAKNRGGAWGLLQDEPESIRRPFFLGISFLAIIFIVSLYRKLTPQQWALKWGLPLVLGGAIGNLVNRIQYNYVIDFIDFHARWVKRFNATEHWPTFNVADIAIVVGVGLMAIDMFTPRKPVAKFESLAVVAGADVPREPVTTGETPNPATLPIPFTPDAPIAPVAPVIPPTAPTASADVAPKET